MGFANIYSSPRLQCPGRYATRNGNRTKYQTVAEKEPISVKTKHLYKKASMIGSIEEPVITRDYHGDFELSMKKKNYKMNGS